MAESTLVLLIEEDSIVRNQIGSHLRNAGFLVVTEGNPILALESIEKDRPQLILTSIFLSGYDIIQLLIRVRSQHPSLPIVGMFDSGKNMSMEIGMQSSLMQRFGVKRVVDVNAQCNTLIDAVNEIVESQTIRSV